MSFKIHKASSKNANFVDNLYDAGTNSLRNNDGGGDYPPNTVVEASPITTNWNITPDNGDMLNDSQRNNIFNNLPSKGGALLVHDYEDTPGLALGDKLILLENFWDPGMDVHCSTVIHEVGHVAGCGHISIDQFFMTPSIGDPSLTSGYRNRKKTTSSEKTKYESL